MWDSDNRRKASSLFKHPDCECYFSQIRLPEHDSNVIDLLCLEVLPKHTFHYFVLFVSPFFFFFIPMLSGRILLDWINFMLYCGQRPSESLYK